MSNVTDSLDIVYDQLVEQIHLLDAALAQLTPDALRSPTGYERPRGAVAVALTCARSLLATVDQERRLLVELAQMVRSVRCGNCRRWFEVVPGGGRAPEYCSQACRQAAYRARQQASSLLSQMTDE